MTDSSTVQAAVAANLIVIRQGIALLAELGDKRYTRRIPVVFDASIGGHLRHIIEHYQSFFASLESGELNYEKRARNTEIENSHEFASGILAAIADRLGALGIELAERPLAYCIETSPGKNSRSSVLRELEFLLSHTVHHYALVAVMCRLQDLEPGKSFGVAPSTLRYQQSLTTCAP